ncbi:hypothetical protein [Deinococcus depolymerans]
MTAPRPLHHPLPHPLHSAGPPVWDVTRAAGLGALPASPDALAFLPDLRAALAGVLVAAGGVDLVFVGRSPEPLRAYLGGLLWGVGVPWRVSGLNVSLLNATLDAGQVRTLRPLLAGAGLHPRELVRSGRRAALVDVVASGGTFAELHRALRDWAQEDGLGGRCVTRRVRLVGLLRGGYARPAAQRWNAQSGLRGVQARSVLTGAALWSWLAEDGGKVAPRFPADTWAAPPGGLPARDPERLAALAQARTLFLLGQRRDERAVMTAALNAAGGQRVAAVRALCGAWRGAASPLPERGGRLPRHRPAG